MGSQNPYNHQQPQGAPRPQTPYEACYGAPGARPQTPGAGPQRPGRGAGPGDPASQPSRQGMSEEEFEQLCRQIGQTVDQVSRAVGKGLGQAGSALGDVISRVAEKQRQAAAANTAQAPAAPAANAASGALDALASIPGSLSAKAAEKQRLALLKARFKSPGGLMATGVVLAVLGGYGVFALGVGDIAFTAESLATGATDWVAGTLVLSAGAALCAWPLSAGIRRIRTARLAGAFRRVFGQREVCTFKELASQAQVSEKRALAASRRMLRHGLLPQGHVDDEGTCLMVTDEAYHQYRATQAAYRERQIAEGAAAAEARAAAEQARAADGELPAEARSLIDEGTRSLARMAELNDAIADPLVSAKIDAISQVVGRILDRVRDVPAAASSLDRLGGYYLPTTIRLLEAYDDLEEQPVQGEHITGSRQQIERTLDTLRAAYEKLLDETFRDVAMDVSADISVLHAVLAQEGLTASPFDQPAEGSRAQDA